MEESNQKCDLAGDRGTTAAVIWHTVCNEFNFSDLLNIPTEYGIIYLKKYIIYLKEAVYERLHN